MRREPLLDVDEHTQRLAALAADIVSTRARRDAAIAAAFAQGASIVTIARAANLTQARVGAILGNPHRRRGRPPLTARPTLEHESTHAPRRSS